MRSKRVIDSVLEARGGKTQDEIVDEIVGMLNKNLNAISHFPNEEASKFKRILSDEDIAITGGRWLDDLEVLNIDVEHLKKLYDIGEIDTTPFKISRDASGGSELASVVGLIVGFNQILAKSEGDIDEYPYAWYKTTDDLLRDLIETWGLEPTNREWLDQLHGGMWRAFEGP